MRRRAVHPATVAPEAGRWSHAMVIDAPEAGHLVFIAGQTARDPDGRLVGEGDFAAQFGQVYENLRRVVEACGGTLSDIVAFRTMLVRAEDVAAFVDLRDREHERLFPHGDPPPNTLVVVAGLADPRFLLEIEAIAAI